MSSSPSGCESCSPTRGITTTDNRRRLMSGGNGYLARCEKIYSLKANYRFRKNQVTTSISRIKTVTS